MPRETSVIKKIRAYVLSQGGQCYKYHGSGLSVAGMPDLIVVMPQIVCFVETKVQGKKPALIQTKRIAEINAAGGRAFWCDSMESFLAQIGLS